jgi:hypothetical protein
MLLNVNEDTGLWFEMSRKALNVVDDDSPMKNYATIKLHCFMTYFDATNMLTSIKNIIGPDFAEGGYWKDFYIHTGLSRTSLYV